MSVRSNNRHSSDTSKKPAGIKLWQSVVFGQEYQDEAIMTAARACIEELRKRYPPPFEPHIEILIADLKILEDAVMPGQAMAKKIANAGPMGEYQLKRFINDKAMFYERWIDVLRRLNICCFE